MNSAKLAKLKEYHEKHGQILVSVDIGDCRELLNFVPRGNDKLWGSVFTAIKSAENKAINSL